MFQNGNLQELQQYTHHIDSQLLDSKKVQKGSMYLRRNEFKTYDGLFNNAGFSIASKQGFFADMSRYMKHQTQILTDQPRQVMHI